MGSGILQCGINCSCFPRSPVPYCVGVASRCIAIAPFDTNADGVTAYDCTAGASNSPAPDSACNISIGKLETGVVKSLTTKGQISSIRKLRVTSDVSADGS